MIGSPAAYARHQYWMRQAIAIAQQAGDQGEVPVGAILTDGEGNWLTAATNRKERDRDPTAHAELLALRQASQQLGQWRLTDCTLYVTLEPCPMCAGAIIQSRLGCLVYGADDPKTGAVRTVLNLLDHPVANHTPIVIAGIEGQACGAQLHHWFAKQR